VRTVVGRPQAVRIVSGLWIRLTTRLMPRARAAHDGGKALTMSRIEITATARDHSCKNNNRSRRCPFA
jgi:hypothetical protein